MALPVGLVRGLAIDGQFDQRINDLRYNERADRVAAADAEMRAKMFAEDLNYKTAMNPYDSEIIKKKAWETQKQIAQFAKNNPNYKYDPMLRTELNRLKSTLVDNPDLKRGLLVDQQYQEYLKDRQEALKNPQQWDMEALDNEGLKFQNYFKSGHPLGIDGKNVAGMEEPAVYTRPKMFVGNLPKLFTDTGSSVKDGIPTQGQVPGENWLEPKPEQINALVDNLLQEHGREIALKARERGIKEQEIPTWVKNQVLAGYDRKYHAGDSEALFKRNLELMKLKAEREKNNPKPSYTPFDYIADPNTTAGVLTQDESRVLTDDFPQIIIQGAYKPETGNLVERMKAEGKAGDKIDLTGLKFHSKQKYVKGKDGKMRILGYVKVPPALAYEKGIITEYDPDDMIADKPSGDISSQFLGKGAWAKDIDKDGKPFNYVNVSYEVPVEVEDQKLRQRFNSLVDVSRNVPAATDPYNGTQQQTQSQKTSPPSGTRQEFKAKGWSDDMINQYSKSGQIIVK